MGRTKKSKAKRPRPGKDVGKGKAQAARKEVPLDELAAILERAKQTMSPEDHSTLTAAVETLSFLTHELEAKDVSVARLRHLLFGPKTEKSSTVLDKKSEGDSTESETKGTAPKETEPKKRKAKGHGRNPAAAYEGADKVIVPHETLKASDPCPACTDGTIYPMKRPKVLVRVTAMAPLSATVYELAKLRCNLCNEIFSAGEPPGVGKSKYDESVACMIALLKYGTGLPFNRIENLQQNLGVPLPASTQWDLVAPASSKLLPAYQELVRHAAQGEVLHNDDTTMKILELTGERRRKAIARGDIDPEQRVGIFTSGILAKNADLEIALFFTGNKHAGENLADVLSQRVKALAPPIQMCDALSRNMTSDLEVVLSHCLTHSRRRFVEVIDNFPEACHEVLRTFSEVYAIDAKAKKEGLNAEDRLALHKNQSEAPMKSLKKWLEEQIENRIVEPNSGLGQAITYMRKHWEKLTLFLREPGAPMDNNTCERALKKVILHRKNGYFYKSQRGAGVGDLFMSLIHTAERCKTSPFDYLKALLQNTEAMDAHPEKWMPWNYTEALAGEQAQD